MSMTRGSGSKKEEEQKSFQLISLNNQIRRVNIQQMNQFAEIEFLINLCPRIQYFQIGCATSINLTSLVRIILIENRKGLSHLHLLSLMIQTTNEESTSKLSDLDNLEELHQEYTIQRVLNQISIRKNRPNLDMRRHTDQV